MSIHLHIDRLVLHGIELGSQGALDFEAAVQRRLGELLGGMPNGAGAETISLPPRIDAVALGSRVADSLHAGLPAIDGK